MCNCQKVKKKQTYFQTFSILLLVILNFSCSELTKVKDLVDKPTAREKYERQFEDNSPLITRWKEASEKALLDSVTIPVPYVEAGKFTPQSFIVYSYEISLDQGERLRAEIQTDSMETLVFMDLFQQKRDTLEPYEHTISSDFTGTQLQKEISSPGVYKLLVQPEIMANTSFRLKIYKEPVYTFPVASKDNAAVQSIWGADRDAGRRRHEGIDIFAPRGTPVVAATSGRISSTGNKGLGGKQVWLRDAKRGNSLYYAHLDSIIARPGMKVSPGDTLGLVGNTGNARTTAPHLHFGIYKGYRGAQNPLPFVFQTEKPEDSQVSEIADSEYIISKATANLRKGPSTKFRVGAKVKPQDSLRLLGETGTWYHARLAEENFFIHKSLASPL